MVTGAFNNYRNRNDFITDINNAFGDKFHVINVGKRKTNVDFLIKEIDAPDKSKTTMAEQNGIKVITPAEFYALMKHLYTYSNEEQ